MANEILISATTGIAPTVQLYRGAIPIGTPISTTEIGTTGEYVADMPAGLPFGRYIGIASTSGNKIGSGEILWDGNYEIEMSLGMLEGLDDLNPMIVTQNNRTVGDIDLAIAGDGETITTVTRQ